MNQEPRPWEEDFYTVFPYLEGRYVDKDGDSYNGIMSPNIISFIRNLEDTIRQEEGTKVVNEIVDSLPHVKNHICRFNDSPQVCDCYQECYLDCRDKVLSTLNQMKENE